MSKSKPTYRTYIGKNLIFGGMLLLVFSLYRALFLLQAVGLSNRNLDIWELTRVFWFGMRTDLVVMSWIVLPFLVLLIFPLYRKKSFRIFYGTALSVVADVVLLFLVVDLFYFPEGNKHLSFEIATLWGMDSFRVFHSFLALSPGFSLSVSLAFILSVIWLNRRILKEFIPPNQNSGGKRVWALWVIVVPAFILFARGGWQKSVLGPEAGLISRNVLFNQASLNPILSAAFEWKSENILPDNVVPLKKAREVVRETIAFSRSQFTKSKFPIQRVYEPNKVNKAPLNVILIILESWSGKFVSGGTAQFIDGKEVTPNFNRLVQEGIFFPNFYATGGRTTNGLFALLTGIPDTPGMSIAHQQFSLNRFRGLGEIASELGYRSMFLTGSNLEFENLRRQVEHWGFETIFDENDFENRNPSLESGVWGMQDGDFLEESLSILLSKKREPFLSVLLTSSTHHPFLLPENEVGIFGEKVQDHAYLNALHYSDSKLGGFVRRIRSDENLGKNTAILLVADHTHHRGLGYQQDRNIPFLLLNSANHVAKKDNRVAGQLDILPTILTLLRKKVEFSAMGRSLLETAESKDGAYFAYGNLFGFISREYMLFLNHTEKRKPVLYLRDGHESAENHCADHIADCEYSAIRAKSFLNLTYRILKEGRIYEDPPASAK